MMTVVFFLASVTCNFCDRWCKRVQYEAKAITSISTRSPQSRSNNWYDKLVIFYLLFLFVRISNVWEKQSLHSVHLFFHSILGAWIITGGMNTGIMKLVGEIVQINPDRSRPIHLIVSQTKQKVVKVLWVIIISIGYCYMGLCIWFSTAWCTWFERSLSKTS